MSWNNANLQKETHTAVSNDNYSALKTNSALHDEFYLDIDTLAPSTAKSDLDLLGLK